MRVLRWHAIAMLREVRLRNFRRFDDHIVPLRERTVIVGPNNAGKSTIVEAIRLLSLVANRFRNLAYTPVPEWLDEPAGPRGVRPSLRDLNTDLSRVFHAYGDPPAVVEGRFSSGSSIHVYVGPDQAVFAVVQAPNGRFVMTKAQASAVDVSRIAIQPQVAPLFREERLLDRETVRRGLDSPLAPSHFRNQLRLLGGDSYQKFVALAEASWPGLQVRELLGGSTPEEPLGLLIRDGSFVGEVSTMGHGLQMWLQVIWFLARNEGAPTMVLDEPDVYLHADLQRKLMRLVQGSHGQVLIATHSVEIMSEAAPSDILDVNPRGKQSRWLTNLRGVQQVIDRIGGVHNVQIARLGGARRCLFLEGDEDMHYLKATHDVILPEIDSLATLPHLHVGGWDGWQQVLGAAQLLRNSAGDAIASYSIFDSDWHEPTLILERYQEAAARGVRLHVWSRKEFENYLLIPSCIQRVIASGVRGGRTAPSEDQVCQQLEVVASSLRHKVTDDCATDYQRRHRGLALSTVNAWARTYIAQRLAEPDGAISVAPGKEVMARLSSWSDARSGVTFGPLAIARNLRRNEVPRELDMVVTAIHENRPMPPPTLWTTREAALPPSRTR